ncbi:MAG: UDP-N-acetylmuramoyl-L-alanine--D-glutamate ligase [Pseudomonadota bacterium]
MIDTTSNIPDRTWLKGRRLVILGLGASGQSVARFFSYDGLVGADDDPARRPVEIPPFDGTFKPDDVLVLSPGIARDHPAPHPLVAKALKDKIEIISDIDILARNHRDLCYIGVTGTNGKSTVTSMLSHILTHANKPHYCGGNIGTPVLDFTFSPEKKLCVLEVSSFQLETISHVDWDIGVLLNIAPDHQDRYADMQAYAHAKMRLLNHSRHCVIVCEDPYTRQAATALGAGADLIIHADDPDPPDHPGAVITVQGSVITGTDRKEDTKKHWTIDVGGNPILRVPHQVINAATAVTVARRLGCDTPAITDGLNSYEGLAHRMAYCGRSGRVTFINDSKATNIHATIRALDSYENIYWIAGGRLKEKDLSPLRAHLGKVRGVYLIGEGSGRLFQAISDLVPCQQARQLRDAVGSAYADASKHGGVVLLSPVGASFDQFDNYQARGQAFADVAGFLGAQDSKRMRS